MMRDRTPEPSVGFPSDFEHCREIIRIGSKSFHFASLMLPKEVRQAAFATYAFCRIADDEVDLGEDPITALDAMSKRLDRIYKQKPLDEPVDRAFAHVVKAYDMPQALPEALLEGMKWDTQNRRYETLDDLLDYAARVAGSVGAMMSVLMGNRTPEAVARACDLGLAMQLTNIARDVGEDARAGRIYLPLDWMAEAGVDLDEFLHNPQCTDITRSVVKRLLDAAELYYERGLSGVSLLNKDCQTAIRAAGKIYREIGHELRRMDYDSINNRAVVSKSRKLSLLIQASRETSEQSSKDAAPQATQYLVSAVDSKRSDGGQPIPPTRVNWVIDLFMRLEQQNRAI